MTDNKQSACPNQETISEDLEAAPLRSPQTPVLRKNQKPLEIVEDAYQNIRDVVQSQMRASALTMVQGLFAEEVENLCGRSNSRKQDGQCHRGGSDPGSILLNGQRVKVKKLRIKQDGEDVELKTHTALQDYDLLCERVMKHMLRGVSTRDYGGLLEDIQGGVGLSKSSVSRAFLKGSQQSLDELNGRDLKPYEFVSIMIDGIEFGDRCVIAVMGIIKSENGNQNKMGNKIVLGIREGDTENSDVVKDLLQSLIDRGLDRSFPYLFVIDGSKALKKGIKKVFGNHCQIQRCVRHKERNIIKYLSHGHHMEFRRLWKKLHGIADYAEAQKEYEKLRGWLRQRNHEALASLDEAEMDTLTVIKLQLPAALRKTLLSTNPLESMFSIVDTKKDRVKNWKSGNENKQVSRWAAATLIEAEKRVIKIKGHKEVPILETALKQFTLEKEKQVA